MDSGACLKLTDQETVSQEQEERTGSPKGPGPFYELEALEFLRISVGETVWKIAIDLILEFHERADWDQRALFGRLVSPENTFDEPYRYFPDSLSRKAGE
ncbi:MAG: hypothetical protein AVDCRST_MAG93-5848 [uncultured Chloroflexia bacterium]|uniref:Uncharacterized protein n=1 Tax=uncultured Chloroflexia bacterium TaxID=1672391 RepID=A0A6J4L9X8_9CHLR|nr:MAG: hypothetical protein AVDCRST_MAG93-5848 [uncultured Chloroflexia bacterium]